MKAYCISGIGANEKVFHQLTLNFDYIPIKWVPTDNSETLQDYAKKLCGQVDTSEEFVLIGVSYGGMLATEMNNFIHPVKTILISSSSISFLTVARIPLDGRLLGKNSSGRLFGRNSSVFKFSICFRSI